MRRGERRTPLPAPVAFGALLVATVLVCAPPAGAFGGVDPAAASRGSAQSDPLAEREEWWWPVSAPLRVARAYLAPAHEFGPGHRGIDLEPGGDAVVRAPASGIVAFVGDVAGRGILTIDHGGGLVTTLEPVTTALVPGAAVGRGDAAGVVSLGGHSEAGHMHFGVRLEGAYINPLLLLGGVPRAVLLPCCE